MSTGMNLIFETNGTNQSSTQQTCAQLCEECHVNTSLSAEPKFNHITFSIQLIDHHLCSICPLYLTEPLNIKISDISADVLPVLYKILEKVVKSQLYVRPARTGGSHLHPFYE